MIIINWLRVGRVELQPNPHFVPGGISSSMRDFIVLVLILKFLIYIYIFLDKVPQSTCSRTTFFLLWCTEKSLTLATLKQEDLKQVFKKKLDSSVNIL